eukprot:2854436-Amphidinium_carterae.1
MGHNVHAEHHVETLEEAHMHYSREVACVYHGKQCKVGESRLDVLCTGFPCAPFSGQRRGRFTTGSTSSGNSLSLLLLYSCSFCYPLKLEHSHSHAYLNLTLESSQQHACYAEVC